MVVVGLLLLSLVGGRGGEEDEAGSVVADTDMEEVAGVADEEAALGEEVDVASCHGYKIILNPFSKRVGEDFSIHL